MNTDVAPNPIYKEIGMLIRAKRKKMDMVQKTLAGKVGMSRASLANIETGRQNMLVHQLYKFAGALEMMPADLLPVIKHTEIEVGRTKLLLPKNKTFKANQEDQIARLFSYQLTAPTSKKRTHATRSKS